MWENNEEINIFREYLRIPSVHPNPNYALCVDFLKRQATDIGLSIKTYYPAHPKKPIVILTWMGLELKLPSIILNSHMDVVPVFEEHWTHPPFAAEIDEDGKIFARGTQDMKCCGTMYLGAIRQMKRSGISLKRTIHVVFVPDEEIGSEDGWLAFANTQEFKALNAGFALDECSPIPNDFYIFFYGERSYRAVRLEIPGTTGHGSLLHKNTAGEKLRYIIDKFMDFRAQEVRKNEANRKLGLGGITCVNLTMINGGVQNNVLPAVITVDFDIRVGIDVNLNEFEAMIQQWCNEAGDNIKITYHARPSKVEPTKLDATNPYWLTFKKTMTEELKCDIRPRICPGRSDANILRSVGVPTIGLTPIRAPSMAHCHDEYVTAAEYLNGIRIYVTLIQRLGNLEDGRISKL